jgi:hypothetical protein
MEPSVTFRRLKNALTNGTDMHGVRGSGNCFVNGMYLWYKLKFRGIPVIRTRPGTLIPHLMIKEKDGLWHFRVEKNILPAPFHILWFKGRYEKKMV